jgi:hypothetical protein
MTTMLAVMLVAVAYVIMDLDHPRSGVLRVSQRSLIGLRDSIAEDAAPVEVPGVASAPSRGGVSVSRPAQDPPHAVCAPAPR